MSLRVAIFTGWRVHTITGVPINIDMYDIISRRVQILQRDKKEVRSSVLTDAFALTLINFFHKSFDIINTQGIIFYCKILYVTVLKKGRYYASSDVL